MVLAGKKFVFSLMLSLLLGACSAKRVAVDIIGDALAGGGGGTYASDDDPELVREAMPFGLKTYEGLLEVSPEHRGLLLAVAQGFTAYAYILKQDADRLEATDLDRARAIRRRASELFLRGRDYALRGLDVAHPGFSVATRQDREGILDSTVKADLPFLYWGGVAWAAALGAAKDDLELVAELPIAAAMVARVLVLDETFDRGAAHEFFVSYEGGRPGGSDAKARQHYLRALELSGGTRASLFVSFAEAVTISAQDRAEFDALLMDALAVDIDRVPQYRLANVLSKRRARWLGSRASELFL
jgi:predicted anti-sigma-YlaC factor YlaD